MKKLFKNEDKNKYNDIVYKFIQNNKQNIVNVKKEDLNEIITFLSDDFLEKQQFSVYKKQDKLKTLIESEFSEENIFIQNRDNELLEIENKFNIIEQTKIKTQQKINNLFESLSDNNNEKNIMKIIFKLKIILEDQNNGFLLVNTIEEILTKFKNKNKNKSKNIKLTKKIKILLLIQNIVNDSYFSKILDEKYTIEESIILIITNLNIIDLDKELEDIISQFCFFEKNNNK